jgi:hypothetical protein
MIKGLTCIRVGAQAECANPAPALDPHHFS